MSDRKRKKENMQLLHDTLIYSLTENERKSFTLILNEFQNGRDRSKFVLSLRRLLTSPSKQEVVPYLLAILPTREREHFLQMWMQTSNYNAFYELDNNSNHTAASVRSDNRSTYSNPYPLLNRKDRSYNINVYSNTLPPRPPNNQRQKSVTFKAASTISDQNRQAHLAKKKNNPQRKSKTRFVSLQRDTGSGDFGFSIRGGSEHGLGIYVSNVQEGSVADKMCLSCGDQLLQVNKHSFQNIDHPSAVKVRKNGTYLIYLQNGLQ